MLQGTLCEVRFEWPKNQAQGSTVIKEEDLVEMRETGRTDLCVNQVCYINGKLHTCHLTLAVVASKL